jgi:hypothetical protein
MKLKKDPQGSFFLALKMQTQHIQYKSPTKNGQLAGSLVNSVFSRELKPRLPGAIIGIYGKAGIYHIWMHHPKQ